MTDRVLVALDREVANGLHDAATADEALTAIEHEVVAALEVDPDEQVEQVARAIAGTIFKPGTVDKAFTGDGLELVRDQAMKQARAVLVSLTGGDGLVEGRQEPPAVTTDEGGKANG